MKTFKKFIFTGLLLLAGHSLFSEANQNLQEYTLDNGMKIYLLEDNSDALVHISFICKAGFSSQNQNTCGFFTLYTNLLNQITSEDFTQAQCNADSSVYSLDIPAAETDRCLDNLSNLFFSPDFSKELITRELNKLKLQITQNSEELSTYLNAAIDSKVFSDAPWKNDSGIYPSIFKKTGIQDAENIIHDISNRWYIPKNSALFIYGNINSEKIRITINQTFGRFYTNYNTPVSKPSVPVNKQRKFVLHHPDISKDLTQIVVQYTLMNFEECDLLSSILNADYSSFKEKLLNIQELNIPGSEYIDVSSAHKRESSRLIIQSLLQPPADKKTKISSLEQTKMFLQEIQNIPEVLSDIEVSFGKQQLNYNFDRIMTTPSTLMNYLSSLWPIEQYMDLTTETEENENYPQLLQSFLYHNKKINRLGVETLSQKINAENPFVFVIINSRDYQTNKKAYQDAGFEEINQNNSSWYVQTLYKEIKDQFKPDSEVYYNGNNNSGDNSYYQKNLQQIENRTLSNGINVISKQNKNSSDITLLLSIQGGKLNSVNDNGYEEVMNNLLSGIIEKEISKKQNKGLIIGYPKVSCKTDFTTSSILIEFQKQDQETVIQSISDAIIFGEIAPADADKAVSARQYRKRLENGSAVNQMYFYAVKSIYPGNDIHKIFDTDKDVLVKTNYTSILNGYPALLDAKRYSIILTGNFDQDIFPILEKNFSLLEAKSQNLKNYSANPVFPKNQKQSVQIRHTFLTDIPAQEAGPQPAQLIPTTEFQDPVLYISKAPDQNTKEYYLYKAILNYLGILLQQNYKTSVTMPSGIIDFGTIVLNNVTHTKEADSLYKRTINNLIKKLSDGDKKTLEEIRRYWILNQLDESGTNTGTAQLIQKGFELCPNEPKPEYYLEEYNVNMCADAQNYLDVLNGYFPTKAVLSVYSSDAKE